MSQTEAPGAGSKATMVDSRKLGTKTMGRLGLAAVGAVLALALAPVVAQAAPTLAITSPVNGTVTGSPGISFAGTTTDPTDPIRLTIEGSHGEVVHETVTSPGEVWAATVSLPDDSYTAVAEQAEGPEPPTVSAPVSFTVKTKKPDVSIFTPAVNGETVRLGGRAGDSPGDVPEVTVYISKQGSETPQVVNVVPEGDEWRVEALELPAGNYIVRAIQRDSVHSEPGEALETFKITINAPVVTLGAPEFTSQGGTLVSSNATPTFQAAPVSGINAVTLDIYAGTSVVGNPIEQMAMSPSGELWSARLAQPLANGIYTAQAEVADTTGSKGVSAPVIFSVQVAGATIAPVSPGLSPPTASFTWVPASPAVGQSVSLVSNSAGGSSPINAFAWDPAGNGPFVAGGSIFTTSFASVGPHVVRLRVSDANGLSSVVQKTIGVVAPAPKLMQPFPIVRIAGAETSSGVRVKLLTVQTPPSTKVVVTCKGPGCKTKSESRVAKASATSKNKTGAVTLAFQRFERPLRVGVILQIRVSKAGQIGKFTGFKIRRHKLPQRTDACLLPSSSVPIPCPVS
jgi:hypothetical protein